MPKGRAVRKVSANALKGEIANKASDKLKS